MSEIIKEYYKKTKLDDAQINSKIEKFTKHEDVKKEFEYWIEHKHFIENGLVVEGYSASKLAESSSYLNGEGAFVMLMKLRENPENALKQIKEGLKMK